MSDALIRSLPWDSAHFGHRIARALPRRLDHAGCRQLEAACVDQNIDCLYFLADAADQATIACLQAGGFDFVDIRLTLENEVRSLLNIQPVEGFRFRLGQAGDLEALLPIAGESYTMSRFYSDQRFNRDKASRMYQTWLGKAFAADNADVVIVAERDGQAVGYVVCHMRKPPDEANLGLVGVADSARGMGCARGMLQFAGSWLWQRDFERVNVVTQAKNIAAQRTYQRCGFLTRSVELWFHKWFQPPAGMP